MGVEQLKLNPGEWLVIDCGKMPSESNCQLVMLAPADQKEDLINAGVKHAVSKHGHKEDGELKNGVASMCTTVRLT